MCQVTAKAKFHAHELNDIYGPSGQVIDLDWLMVHGQEGSEPPFPCRYFGDDLPTQGMTPAEFYCREDE